MSLNKNTGILIDRAINELRTGRPIVLEEKGNFLSTAATENYVLYLEHDHDNECCTLQHTEKGVRLKDTFSLKELG